MHNLRHKSSIVHCAPTGNKTSLHRTYEIREEGSQSISKEFYDDLIRYIVQVDRSKIPQEFRVIHLRDEDDKHIRQCTVKLNIPRVNTSFTKIQTSFPIMGQYCLKKKCWNLSGPRALNVFIPITTSWTSSMEIGQEKARNHAIQVWGILWSNNIYFSLLVYLTILCWCMEHISAKCVFISIV